MEPLELRESRRALGLCAGATVVALVVLPLVFKPEAVQTRFYFSALLAALVVMLLHCLRRIVRPRLRLDDEGFHGTPAFTNHSAAEFARIESFSLASSHRVTTLRAYARGGKEIYRLWLEDESASLAAATSALVRAGIPRVADSTRDSR